MGRLSKKDMEELREFCSLGCDCSGAKDVVMETAEETLRQLGSNMDVDCMYVSDGEDTYDLEEFIEKFYTNVLDKIMNVVETQGK